MTHDTRRLVALDVEKCSEGSDTLSVAASEQEDVVVGTFVGDVMNLHPHSDKGYIQLLDPSVLLFTKGVGVTFAYADVVGGWKL